MTAYEEQAKLLLIVAMTAEEKLRGLGYGPPPTEDEVKTARGALIMVEYAVRQALELTADAFPTT